MRKSCLKSANDKDAHQSMHPVRTVGSVHATNKNIENELSHTWPRHSKDKCSRAQLRTFQWICWTCEIHKLTPFPTSQTLLLRPFCLNMFLGIKYCKRPR